ncbi:MAG: transporter suffix domain-containing protein [Bacteroidota bacterium]
MQKPNLPAIIAIILILLSGVLFGLIFVVPFLPLTITQKGIFVTALVIGMEITWWLGVALVGKQLLTKYIKYLNPRNWGLRK